MTRRQQIESIIIGTLLNSINGKNYYENCKSCITSDMFQSGENAKIYETIAEMSNNGKTDFSPYHLAMFNERLLDIASYMCYLATDFYFEDKKARYNAMCYFYSNGKRPEYTRVSFDDYVSRFIQIVFGKNAKN